MMGKYIVKSIEYCIAVIIIFLIISNITAASDNVDTEVSFTFNDAVELNVETTIEVHMITIPANGISYSKSEIQSLLLNNPEMMGAIKISVKGLMQDQLYDSFPESDISSPQELPTFSNGVFYDMYTISLLPSFFSLNESIDISSYINGFLDCGVYVNYTFSLKSYAGWNQSYVFTVPQPLNYKRTNGDVKQNQITWNLVTLRQPAKKQAELTLLDMEPTSPYSENSTIHVEFIIDCIQPENPLLKIRFRGYHSDVTPYDIIPDFISNVKTLPADGIRLCVFEEFISWEKIKNLTFDPAYYKVKLFIENSSFNQTIHSLFFWKNNTTLTAFEPFNISHMDSTPPITADYIDDTILFTMCNISSRAFYGIINSGASVNITEKDINIGDNLESLPLEYNGSLQFPNHVLLNNKNEVKWDKYTPIKGSFSSSNPPLLSDNDITTQYYIDVKNTDLNLLSFFTGKTELSMGLSLKETQYRNCSKLPVHFNLPSKITIPFFPSDGFRVCIEEGVFLKQQIQEFTSYQKDTFQTRSKTLFPLIKGNPVFDQELFDSSLKWDKNISSMDSNDPIVLSSSIQTTFPLIFDFSLIPPRVSIRPLNLSFSGIPDQSITYSMFFPKGIAIDASDTFNRVKTIQLANGKKGFSLTFNASEGGDIDSVLIALNPSGLYIIGMFIPCIVSIFITIILLLLVFIIRKKRRNIPSSYDESSQTDYEQEEYYIPPPPSKRK